MRVAWLAALAALTATSSIVCPAAAAVCSTGCSDEFVKGCVPAMCAEGTPSEKADPLGTCRATLESGAKQLANAGCIPGCTNTAAMTAVQACGGGPSVPAPPPPPAEACAANPAEKPNTPTPCTAANKGCCNCGESDGKVTTYVWWHADNAGNQLQRCLQTYGIPVSGAAVPVVILSGGYGSGGPDFGGSDPEDPASAANRYGFAVFELSPALRNGTRLADGGAVGGFGLEFGSQAVVNDTHPTPCSVADSRDVPYITAALDLIAAATTLDTNKVFISGFSQESMFAAYTAVCFAGRIKGVWQGGSGMARNSQTPVVPGLEGQCARNDYLELGSNCCAQRFCTGCKYFPIYPKTCGKKLIDCLMTYEGDELACGADANMYEAMVAEGNDARLLLFPGGGHGAPPSSWAWQVGCLGITDACSASCETTFSNCVGGAVNAIKFASCDAQMHNGDFAASGCVPGCAPTLPMLRLSIVPAKTVLSAGKFGTTSGLAVGPTTVTHTTCTKGAYGPFGSANGNGGCNAPAGHTPPDFSVRPPDSVCGSSSNPTTSASTGTGSSVRNILPLGDSITEGVPFTYRYALDDKLTQEGYAFDFVGSHTNGGGSYPQSGWDRDNEGWAGWTIGSIEEKLSEWASAYTVDVALIHLGTNDAGGNDVEGSAAAVASIVQQLRGNNAAVSICIAQILPFGPLPAEPGEPGTTELNAFVSSWNSRLATLASAMTTPASPIVLVDMNSGFSNTDLSDGVHPTQSGAAKMADKWLECILSLSPVAVPTTPPPSPDMAEGGKDGTVTANAAVASPTSSPVAVPTPPPPSPGMAEGGKDGTATANAAAAATKKAYADAGCDDDAAKPGCAELKTLMDDAAAQLEKADPASVTETPNATTAAQSTGAAGGTATADSEPAAAAVHLLASIFSVAVCVSVSAAVNF